MSGARPYWRPRASMSFEMPLRPIACTSSSTRRVRDTADPGLLDHRDQRLLGSLARLEERREVRSLTQLGDAQLQRAEARVQTPLAISVAVIEPVSAALVTAGADQAFDIGLHQNLQHRLSHGS